MPSKSSWKAYRLRAFSGGQIVIKLIVDGLRNEVGACVDHYEMSAAGMGTLIAARFSKALTSRWIGARFERIQWRHGARDREIGGERALINTLFWPSLTDQKRATQAVSNLFEGANAVTSAQ